MHVIKQIENNSVMNGEMNECGLNTKMNNSWKDVDRINKGTLGAIALGCTKKHF